VCGGHDQNDAFVVSKARAGKQRDGVSNQVFIGIKGRLYDRRGADLRELRLIWHS